MSFEQPKFEISPKEKTEEEKEAEFLKETEFSKREKQLVEAAKKIKMVQKRESPEKEPQPQVNKPEKETELERKRRLGKESEWTIDLPLFHDLKEEGVLSYAEHTTKEVDEGKQNIDFVWGLEDRSHLAIQISLSEEKEIWEEKIKKIISEDEKGRIFGRPYEELKDIHPKPEILSRRQRLEQVPKIPLRIDWETINNAYTRFEAAKKGVPFDFLPQKREIEKELLSQALDCLHVFSADKKLARYFPRLPAEAQKRYEVLRGSVLKFLKKEVK